MAISLDELHDIAVRIAPELRGKLAIVEQPQDWLSRRDVAAYTVHGRDLQIRDELQRLGRWPGAWPTTIVACGELTPGLLLHELAHCLPARELLSDLEPTVEQKKQQEFEQRFWAKAGREYLDAHFRFPWSGGHELPWIRTLCHLLHRARARSADIAVAYRDLHVSDYGLSPLGEYEAALGYEPHQYCCSSFDEILAAPMPASFVRLYATDCSNYTLKETLYDYRDKTIPASC